MMLLRKDFRRTRASGLVLFSVFAVGGVLNGGGPRVSMDDVQQAWRSRQERVRTARFDWKETCFISAGSRKPKRSAAKIVLLPAKDIEFERTVKVSFSGDMMRYSREGAVWEDSLGELINRTYISTFDGETSRRFYSDDDTVPRRFVPVGFDNAVARNLESNYYMMAPVLLSFRGCIPDMGGREFEAFHVSPKTAQADGSQCLILAREDDKIHLSEEFWVDARRDFVIVLIERTLPGKVTSLQVTYQDDKTHGWVPSTWKWIATAPQSGRIFEQAVATVTQYEINTEIPRAEFGLTFPAGTIVRDRRRNEDYVQRDGNEKRRITQGEIARGATYDELLRTESGMARYSPSRHVLIWGGLVGIILAVILALAFRHSATKR